MLFKSFVERFQISFDAIDVFIVAVKNAIDGRVAHVYPLEAFANLSGKLLNQVLQLHLAKPMIVIIINIFPGGVHCWHCIGCFLTIHGRCTTARMRQWQ